MNCPASNAGGYVSGVDRLLAMFIQLVYLTNLSSHAPVPSSSSLDTPSFMPVPHPFRFPGKREREREVSGFDCELFQEVTSVGTIVCTNLGGLS